jgi:hypothetical protein
VGCDKMHLELVRLRAARSSWKTSRAPGKREASRSLRALVLGLSKISRSMPAPRCDFLTQVFPTPVAVLGMKDVAIPLHPLSPTSRQVETLESKRGVDQ